MTQYTAVIESSWSADHAFRYLSDFSNARFWDPSVQDARRLDDGDIVEGSMFSLTVRFAGRDQVLTYRVKEIETSKRIVFECSTKKLVSLDSLTFEPQPHGCRVTYHAVLRLKGVTAIASPFLVVMFKGLGNRARDCLRTILIDDSAATA